MRFTPPRYQCRTHDEDLTKEVVSKVTNEETVTANLGWRRTPAGMVKVATFQVDIRCPKGDNDGHVLRFRGSYQQ